MAKVLHITVEGEDVAVNPDQLTFGEIDAIENKAGRSFVGILQRAEAGFIGDVALLVFAMLRRSKPSLTIEEVRSWTLGSLNFRFIDEETGEEVDDETDASPVDLGTVGADPTGAEASDPSSSSAGSVEPLSPDGTESAPGSSTS